MAVLVVGLLNCASARGDECTYGSGSSDDELWINGSCNGSGSDGGNGEGGGGSPGPAQITLTAPISCGDEACELNPPAICTNPGERYVYLYVWSDEVDDWVLSSQGCGHAPEGPPEVTSDDVLRALRRVGLPALSVATNPTGKTLVNLDTVFYTSPETVTRTLSILGQSVVVEATPTTYVWHFGDGESASTNSPGAPYPALDLTHKYAKSKVTVRPRVDTTYTARFRVNGGAWQDVNGTVTIDGPPVALRVSEATPVLTGDR